MDDAMQEFSNDGLKLSFIDEGPRDGAPVLLIHGFASNAKVNWISPGWTSTLQSAGYRTIAIDNRGHGQSDKPHESDAYHPELMAGDAAALLRHLAISDAHVMGYSMGARISAFLALNHPGRVNSLTLGGLGINLIRGVGYWDPIAKALLAENTAEITDIQGRAFRDFADKTKSDRFALAACIETSRKLVTPEQVASIAAPTLVAVGTNDDIAGNPDELADMMPAAQAFHIERRDHMLAVGDASFKRIVLSFLDGQE